MSIQKTLKTNYDKNPKAAKGLGALALGAIGLFAGSMLGIIEPAQALEMVGQLVQAAIFGI